MLKIEDPFGIIEMNQAINSHHPTATPVNPYRAEAVRQFVMQAFASTVDSSEAAELVAHMTAAYDNAMKEQA